MSTMFRVSTLLRTAALSAALLVPAVSAFADDEYGTGHEIVIRQAAASPPAAPLSTAQSQSLSEQFRLGQNDAFGASTAVRSFQPAQGSRVASTAPMVGGKPDLVGQGGRQDQLAREIYHPGSGTDW